jgi:hypothetical protein
MCFFIFPLAYFFSLYFEKVSISFCLEQNIDFTIEDSLYTNIFIILTVPIDSVPLKTSYI